MGPPTAALIVAAASSTAPYAASEGVEDGRAGLSAPVLVGGVVGVTDFWASEREPRGGSSGDSGSGRSSCGARLDPRPAIDTARADGIGATVAIGLDEMEGCGVPVVSRELGGGVDVWGLVVSAPARSADGGSAGSTRTELGATGSVTVPPGVLSIGTSAIAVDTGGDGATSDPISAEAGCGTDNDDAGTITNDETSFPACSVSGTCRPGHLQTAM